MGGVCAQGQPFLQRRGSPDPLSTTSGSPAVSSWEQGLCFLGSSLICSGKTEHMVGPQWLVGLAERLPGVLTPWAEPQPTTASGALSILWGGTAPHQGQLVGRGESPGGRPVRTGHWGRSLTDGVPFCCAYRGDRNAGVTDVTAEPEETH